MSLSPGKRDSLVRYTSRLADEIDGLRPGAHRALAATMLNGIGRRCELNHVHLYLTRLKNGPQISLYSEWSREKTPSLLSLLQRVELPLVGEQPSQLLLEGTAVYCGMNEHSDACSRLVTSILNDLTCAAYEMIPILIGERLRGIIALGHDQGPQHLDSVCHHLLQLTGRVFVGSHRAACRESRRRQNHRQWRNVANGACDFALVLDSEIEIVNVVRFRNQTPPAVSGLRLQDIVARTSYEPLQQLIRDAIKSANARTCDFLLLKGNGKPSSFNARIEPGGETATCACTLYLTSNDVERAAADELAQLREHLAQASRLSVIGNLSSEYAHQLTQPLQVIEYQSFILRNRLKNGKATVAEMLLNVAAIRDSVNIASDVIFNLRDFLQDRRARLSATNLGRIIDDATELVQARPDCVTVKLTVEDEEALLEQDSPLEVHVDRVQTTFVLINLLSNAIEACTLAEIAEPEVRIQLRSHASEQYVIVSVSDNGPGLQKHDPESVFKRFFTTKKHGFGIGLAICRDVIERQRGKIQAKNNPVVGCTFTFSMLLQSDKAEEDTRLLDQAADDMRESAD
ncbi:MAG: ATP-binding protein [Planctomycetaceae bacterium]